MLGLQGMLSVLPARCPLDVTCRTVLDCSKEHAALTLRKPCSRSLP